MMHIHKKRMFSWAWSSVGVGREMVALEVTFHHCIALLDKTCSVTV
jgi:hypothetical protein